MDSSKQRQADHTSLQEKRSYKSLVHMLGAEEDDDQRQSQAQHVEPKQQQHKQEQTLHPYK